MSEGWGPFARRQSALPEDQAAPERGGVLRPPPVLVGLGSAEEIEGSVALRGREVDGGSHRDRAGTQPLEARIEPAQIEPGAAAGGERVHRRDGSTVEAQDGQA